MSIEENVEIGRSVRELVELAVSTGQEFSEEGEVRFWKELKDKLKPFLVAE